MFGLPKKLNTRLQRISAPDNIFVFHGDPDVDGYLLVGAWAGYDINALITAALDVEFKAGLDADGNKYNDGSSLMFKPKLTFNVGSGASIDVYDKISIDLPDGDANPKPDAVINNRFQIDFTYSF